MRVLVGQLSTVGRDVRSTTMQWAYESKKLDSTVKHLSWVPPWVRVEGGGDQPGGYEISAPAPVTSLLGMQWRDPDQNGLSEKEGDEGRDDGSLAGAHDHLLDQRAIARRAEDPVAAPDEHIGTHFPNLELRPFCFCEREGAFLALASECRSQRVVGELSPVGERIANQALPH